MKVESALHDLVLTNKVFFVRELAELTGLALFFFPLFIFLTTAPMEKTDLAASREPWDLAEVNAAGNLVEGRAGMGAYRAATALVPRHLTKIRCPDIPTFPEEMLPCL